MTESPPVVPSPEASPSPQQTPPGSRRQRRVQQLIGAVVILAVVSVVAASALVIMRDPAQTPSATADKADKPSELSLLCGQTFGKETAKVRVVAALPVSSGCQDAKGLYAIAVARKFPDMVSAQIFDMKQDSGQQILHAHGCHCAALWINDKDGFDLGDGRGKVILQGPPDSYTVAELRAAMAQELKAAYGNAAPELPPVPAPVAAH